MRLAKHENKGNDEELIAEIVADVQHPVTPIFKAVCFCEGLHDTGRVITRLAKIVYHGAAAIDENVLRVGAVEIHLGHVRPPSNDTWTGRKRDVSVRGILDRATRLGAVTL